MDDAYDRMYIVVDHRSNAVVAMFNDPLVAARWIDTDDAREYEQKHQCKLLIFVAKNITMERN